MNELEKLHQVYFTSDLRGVNEEYHRALRESMLEDVGGMSALEIGVGAGDWTAILSKKYVRLDIIEASESLLKKAVAICENSPADVTFHHSQIENFQPPAGLCWQHVFLTFLLEHLDNPIEVMKRIATWMEPDGKLFIAVPNANSLHREIARRMGLINSVTDLSENDYRVGHRRVYTKDDLCQQIESAGFCIHTLKMIGFKPLNLSQMDKWNETLIKIIARAGDLAGDRAAYIGVVASKNSA